MSVSAERIPRVIERTGTPAGVQSRMAAYLTLTKPGIISFIAITAAAGYVMAAGALLDYTLLLHTVLATVLTAAGSAAMNQIVEARADARMRRTALRPLPSGTIARSHALAFAATLSAAGLSYSLALLPLATTLLLAASHASYIWLYTPLKRRTPLCTLAGAIPGALPILAGWCATGAPVTPTALALAGILFTWQIPHFLAIGWRCREDYERAGFLILCVVDPSGRSTARVGLAYTVALQAISLVPWLTGISGTPYALCAIALSGWYTYAAVRLLADPTAARALRLFLVSLAYLPLLLSAMILDRLF